MGENEKKWTGELEPHERTLNSFSVERLAAALTERDTTISELRAENEALRQMYCGDTDCNVRKEGNVDPAPLIDEAIRLRAEVERLEKLRVEAVSAVTGEAKILLENAALRARVAELEAERDAADALSKLLTEQVNINAEDRDKARTEAAELKRRIEVLLNIGGDFVFALNAFCCDPRNASTTTETPTQAAITAEGEG
jgi:DNA repair exonuclease SbcCD ATPase subunit